jgi:hypothetical protein
LVVLLVLLLLVVVVVVAAAAVVAVVEDGFYIHQYSYSFGVHHGGVQHGGDGQNYRAIRRFDIPVNHFVAAAIINWKNSYR